MLGTITKDGGGWYICVSWLSTLTETGVQHRAWKQLRSFFFPLVTKFASLLGVRPPLKLITQTYF